MAEQAHARFYNGLPPVVSRQRRSWMIAGGVVAIAVFAIAVLAILVVAFTHSPPDYWGLHSRVRWLFKTFIWASGALIVGGALGVAFARGWWSGLSLYLVGFAVWLVPVPVSDSGGDIAGGPRAAHIYGWVFWIVGVSAGVAVRGLTDRRRRRLRASFVSPPG